MSFCIFFSFVGIANVFWSAAIKGSTITASVAMAVLSTVEVASPKSPNGASDPNAKKVAKNKPPTGRFYQQNLSTFSGVGAPREKK